MDMQFVYKRQGVYTGSDIQQAKTNILRSFFGIAGKREPFRKKFWESHCETLHKDPCKTLNIRFVDSLCMRNSAT